jgi:DNA repair protein RadA/Sms
LEKFMAKVPKLIYVCQSCGYQTPKWLGRCPDCGQWNSLVEELSEPTTQKALSFSMDEPQSIDAISLDPQLRLKTNIAEFDRALGGGVVPGSLVLVGGDPGIGKSTLVLQVAGHLSREGLRTLYLSGE